MGPTERCAGFDLDAESRASLEFDALLDWVAGFACCALGVERIRSLEPRADPGEVDRELRALREMWAWIDEKGALVPRGLPDPRSATRKLQLEGSRLELAELVDLSVVLAAASDVRSALLGLAEQEAPRLWRVATQLPDLREESRQVLDGIEPDGRIADRASDELAGIRAATARVGGRLRKTLDSFLRDPGSEATIRDDFITQRNGRFVIPVRTDAPRAVRGIVHATSSSGATQFVEPMETVELNNELVRLSDRERAEVDRILRRWSDAFRRRVADVLAATRSLALLDSRQARVLFGKQTEGVLPTVEPGGRLAFKQVRHPLLDRRLRERGEHCSPLDLVLDPADQVLVLSGPNTGGKTVALKTFGLAVLMAQSGIPVPAVEVELPLFAQLRADIGDHLSIHADLSTYSAHIRSVVGFLESAQAPALFLFDEIGTGTDPAEGAALARSTLEALARPGMTTMATTHQGVLKSWAFTTEGAACAAMEFDEESLRPTFRILMGAAGTSAGLTIAERLGLDAQIVERARTYMGAEQVTGEAYMNRLRELMAELEQRRDDLEGQRQALAEQSRRLDRRSAQRVERTRREAASKLEQALTDFRREARKGLAAIVERREQRRAERDVVRLEGRLGREKARHTADLVERTESDAWRPAGELGPGMRVRVNSLGREGQVERIRGEKIEVKLGTVVFTVKRSDLRVPVDGGAATPEKVRADRPLPRPREVPDVPGELVLVGQRVEEAIEELDRYLDAAVLAGRREVRVVHGHGTGRLRRAVREYLRSHLQVRRRRAGKAHEGGDAATIVELA